MYYPRPAATLLVRTGHPSAKPMSTASFRAQSANPLRYNDKRKIVEHYDFVSPYYHSLWGEHLHHGYWIRGDESKELAQLQLTEYLAELANVQTGSAVLDIGCGFGASSLYLPQNYRDGAAGLPFPPLGGEMAGKAEVLARLEGRCLGCELKRGDFRRRFGASG